VKLQLIKINKLFQKRNKRVVYTSITGSYDKLLNHSHLASDWDYVCFSDTETANEENDAWDILPLTMSQLDNVRNQRWHKVNAHKVLKRYKYTLYLDANIDIISPDFFIKLNESIASGAKLALPKHPKRNCTYQELVACIAQQKDDSSIMKKQIEFIKINKLPKNYGMYASGILLRKTNDRTINRAMEDWWNMIEKYSYRDQLSLPFVLWKYNIEPSILKVTIYDDDSRLIKFKPHSRLT
jgi:hypothetical protein